MSYPNDGLDERSWRDEVFRRMKALVNIAEQEGIILGHENCDGWGSQSPEHLRYWPWRHVAFKPFYGPWRKDEHAVGGLAPYNLLPGEGGDIDLRPINILREYRGSCVNEG